MIIVTGTLAYDYIMEFPGKFGEYILPKHTNNINLSFIVDKFAKHRGGTAGNVSYTMGLLKTPHLLFSYAGSDFEEYKKAFDALAIDTSHVVIDADVHTATGFAMTDASNNQIWGYYYGASGKTPSLKLETVAKPLDFIIIGPQGAKGSISFVKQCIELKIPYMFDPGFILTEVSDKDLTTGITHADFIIGNEYEIELIKTRVANFKLLSKNKTVITTLGDKGASINNQGKMYNIAPVKVKTVVSTTGAGDAWRGGFLSGYIRGQSMQTCGQIGAVAASYVVEHFGTQEHKYTLGEFQDRYRQTYDDLLKL